MTATATRTISWLFRPDPRAAAGSIRVHAHGVETVYYLTETTDPRGFGRTFRLDKAAEDCQSYTVNLGGAAYGRSSCTCRGYAWRGSCKHVDALRALRAAGRL